jgi:hypothetical protein
LSEAPLQKTSQEHRTSTYGKRHAGKNCHPTEPVLLFVTDVSEQSDPQIQIENALFPYMGRFRFPYGMFAAHIWDSKARTTL